MGFFDFLKRNSIQNDTIKAKSSKSNIAKANVQVSFTTHDYTLNELEQQRNQKVNEIKELAQSSFPSKNGLRPHEIFMLSHAPHYNTERNSFPQFWHYEFGIDNPQAILNMLLERGFIRIATAKESVEKLKVPELKEILSEHGIKAAGKKVDLVALVRENVSEEDLGTKIPFRRYALTDLGEQEVKENEYVIYFGSSIKYGLTVWDMNKMIQGYPLHLYRDQIWGNLNKKAHESMASLQKDNDIYSFYLREISLRYEMCDFLIEENKHPLDALKLWARAAFYDIMVKSPAEMKMLLDLEKHKVGPTMKRINDPKTGESILVEDNSPPQFRDNLNLSFKVSSVRILKEKLGFSDDELFQNLVLFFQQCQPVMYELIRNRNITKLNLSHQDIAGLVVAESNEDSKIADTIYKDIEIQIKQDKSPVWKK